MVADSLFLSEALFASRAPGSRYREANEFATGLRKDGVIVLYSPLVFLEATQFWRRLYRRRVLGASGDPVDERSRRRRAVSEAARQRDARLARLGALEFPNTMSASRFGQ